MKFKKANLTPAEVAAAMHTDPQTIRLLLQQGLVSWGFAYKRTPQSRQFSYIISPKLFYESTGVVIGDVADE